MTIFELVKVALDALYSEGTEQHGSNIDAEIKKQIGYLSTGYSQLHRSDREPVNYKDPSTRFAYMYKYVASHSDYVVQVLEAVRTHLLSTEGKDASIFAGDSIRVSCIGGGPGSDIIAVLKYLDEDRHTERVDKVTCYLLDRQQAWADTWTELDDSLELDLRLHANFQPLDVTDPDTWAQQRKFLQADL
jgi:putative SAM-dependent methyltransferase